MVSKRERLEAAIAGDIADRPPVSLWRHFPVDDQDPISLSDSVATFQEEYDFDFIKVTPASSYCLRDWGVEDEWRGHPEGTRGYMGRVVKHVHDWERLEVLDPTSGFLGDHLQSLKMLKERIGNQVPIITTIFSPLAQCKNLAGAERLGEHLNTAPSDVELGLEIISKSTIAFIEALRALDIDGIFYAIQHASYQHFDPSSYQRFGETYDLKILEAAEGLWLNVLHLHGEALLFDIPARYPVQIINWHDRETWPDLVEGKRKTHSAVCGGVKRGTITYGAPEDVEAEAHQALHSLDGGRGMVLGTGCVIPIITPWVNIRAFRGIVDFA